MGRVTISLVACLVSAIQNAGCKEKGLKGARKYTTVSSSDDLSLTVYNIVVHEHGSAPPPYLNYSK